MESCSALSTKEDTDKSMQQTKVTISSGNSKIFSSSQTISINFKFKKWF